MLFNSLVFLIYFPVVYMGYLALRRRVRGRNAWLLLASYVFYGWWDPRFLSLLVISTVTDFFIGLLIARHRRYHGRIRLYLLASICVNLGILGFFKYANFFIDSARQAFSLFGSGPSEAFLQIVLPVGISFYTFQTMSYTIDIYRRQMQPTRSLLDFALFVAFFPQLVAGPIERARHLLPQISRYRPIAREDLSVGLWLITIGFFKKVVVADNLAVYVDRIFDTPSQYAGMDIGLGVLAFAFQIYGDFAGYSNIARGLARLMGFDLMVNFRVPYAALTPSDFWQRWHISLSTWLRDYLYIPLGGNRRGIGRTYWNLMVTMLLGGLWHGAAWNFVAWGLFHGMLLCAYRMLSPLLVNLSTNVTTSTTSTTSGTSGTFRSSIVMAALARKQRIVLHLLMWCLMTIFTMIGWLLFRADSITTAWEMFLALDFSRSTHTAHLLSRVVLYASPLVILDIWTEARGNLLAPLQLPPALLTLLYCMLLIAIIAFRASSTGQFIYFQF